MDQATASSVSRLAEQKTSHPVALWTGWCVMYCHGRSWPLSTENLARASRSWPWTCPLLLAAESNGEAGEQRKAEWFTLLLKEPGVLRRVCVLTRLAIASIYTSLE